jgi:predicted 3-demethylubiquinone-9 3-methyltransferase (glyoxalase superfamily)
MDEKNSNNVYRKYTDSFEQDKILALTNNGLELLTKDQYEAAKGKYTINDKNVKCIDEK